MNKYEEGCPIPFRNGVAFSVNGASLGNFKSGTVFVSGADGSVNPIESEKTWLDKYSFKSGTENAFDNLINVPKDFLTKFSSLLLGDKITAQQDEYIDGTIISLGSKFYIFDDGLAKNITLEVAKIVKLYVNDEWVVPVVEAELDGFIFGAQITAEEISTIIPSWK